MVLHCFLCLFFLSLSRNAHFICASFCIQFMDSHHSRCVTCSRAVAVVSKAFFINLSSTCTRMCGVWWRRLFCVRCCVAKSCCYHKLQRSNSPTYLCKWAFRGGCIFVLMRCFLQLNSASCPFHLSLEGNLFGSVPCFPHRSHISSLFCSNSFPNTPI